MKPHPVLPVYSHAYPSARKISAAALRRHRHYATNTFAASGAVLILLLVVGGILQFYATAQPHYVLVIDAGSSGTRLHLYTWEMRRGIAHVVEVRGGETKHLSSSSNAYDRKETVPGLDTFAHSGSSLRVREGVEGALTPLLQWAHTEIPEKYHATTPVILLGTAGMRKLDADEAELLLGAVRKVLEASPFRFESSWARIITGDEEGIYGWVALNYLSGALMDATQLAGIEEESYPSVRGDREVASHELLTFGTLDLGGSSLEVSFVPSSRSPSRPPIEVLGVPYSLYTHSHLHYGLNDAFDTSVKILLHRKVQLDLLAKKEMNKDAGFFSADDIATTTIATTIAINTGAGGLSLPDSTPVDSQPRANFSLGMKSLLETTEIPRNLETGHSKKNMNSISSGASSESKGSGGSNGSGSSGGSGGSGGSSGSGGSGGSNGSAVSSSGGNGSSRGSILSRGSNSIAAELVDVTNVDFGKRSRDAADIEVLASSEEESGGGDRNKSQVSEGKLESKSMELKPVPGKKSGREVVLEHPCLNTGYNRTYSSKTVDTVQLIGKPDWDACEALAMQVVNASQPCPKQEKDDAESLKQPCALGAPQPHPLGVFHALSGFYVVFHYFALPETASLEDLVDAGKEYCRKPWELAKQGYGNTARVGGEVKYADRYCFRAPYVAHLLRDGLGVLDSQIRVGQKNVGWTLGAAILEAGKINIDPHTLPSSVAIFTEVPRETEVLVGMAALLLGFVVLVFLYQRSIRPAASSTKLKASRNVGIGYSNRNQSWGGSILPSFSRKQRKSSEGSEPVAPRIYKSGVTASQTNRRAASNHDLSQLVTKASASRECESMV